MQLVKLMAVEHNRDRSPSAACLRALVVDDYVLAAQGLAQLLEMLGHETRCTVRGREALQIAREFAPNLIMIDLHLADINGFEVVNALRGDPRVAR